MIKNRPTKLERQKQINRLENKLILLHSGLFDMKGKSKHSKCENCVAFLCSDPKEICINQCGDVETK